MYIHKFTYVSIYIYILILCLGWIFDKFPSDLKDSESPQIWLQSCRQWNQGTVGPSSSIVPSLGSDPLSSLPNARSHYSSERMSERTNKIGICIFSKQPSPDSSRNLDCLEHQG